MPVDWLRRKLGADPPPPSAPDPAAADSPEQLRERIADVVRHINRSSGDMPGAAVVRARRLTDTLQEIIDTAAIRPLDIYAVMSVRNTLNDYLPTTLQRYLAVPEGARHLERASGKTPAESLVEQLEALQVSASSVLVASQHQDVDSLMTQGSFLATKFSGSDLDL